MITLGEFRIYEHPLAGPVPKIQIRHDFEWVTDDVRADINAWLLETFGTTEHLYFIGESVVFASPKACAILRNFT